ncbi:MAG: sporulation protein YqfC [Clostridiales bacterium]|jgi:sporulation protein YqfC|nr:sporulation protein YqfC [Clostridiales bacterium]
MAKLLKAMADLFEIPAEAATDAPYITFVGGELLVSNYKGISEYASDRLRIGTSMGTLRVEGEKMALRRVSAENIFVTGKILGVYYT